MELLRREYDLEPRSRAAARLSLGKGRRCAASTRARSHPQLWVIDKANGGKSDALNVALDYCHTPLFCSLDADTALERDALLRLCRSFLENGDTSSRRAGSCAWRTARRSEKGQAEGREAARRACSRSSRWSSTCVRSSQGAWAGPAGGVLLIVSGAFGMFRRDVVVDAGGYSTRSVGEDMELIVRLHRYMRERKRAYEVQFVPDPVAWTEVPETLSVLTRQRDRWQRGLMQSLAEHRVMLMNPKYGRIGMVAYPYFWFMEGFGPAVEVLGYAAFTVAFIFGWVATEFVIAFLLLSVFSGIALSLAAVGLEELSFRRYTGGRDFARLLLLSVIENFGYRQYLAFARFKGLIMAAFGRREWGAMQKRGVLEPEPIERTA
jgi:cellulose synthase/poly-beta-1,6-N-acetylglucosamine synthase-like glycosyltransferase